LQRLDEWRLLAVKEFGRRLMMADEVVRYGVGRIDEMNDGVDEDLDADDSIGKDLRSFLGKERENVRENNPWQRLNDDNQDTSPSRDNAIHNLFHGQTPQQIQNTITSAQNLLSETKSFLPQLVSTVLHSPPALQQNTVDPISSLRSLLLRRCQLDPSLGIELCWLLEAEVVSSCEQSRASAASLCLCYSLLYKFK
jgi:hypothetical protein